MIMKRALCLILAVITALAGGFSLRGKAEGDGDIEALLARMTLHEKVCQLFFVQPEQFSRLDKVTAGSGKLRQAFARFPVGGVILFPSNMTNRSLASLNAAMQSYALENGGVGLFIGTDEEGGGVSRVAVKLKRSDKQPSAMELGEKKDPEAAYQAAAVMGKYLKDYGFNVDFAPVADVRADVKRAEITTRSFGSDPHLVAGYVARFVQGLQEQGVMAVLKHFPGHGAVSGDTHKGPGISQRTLAQWRSAEFLPFRSGLDAGAGMVLMSHQSAPQVDSLHLASLSPTVVGLLRKELGFEGVIITDALRMDAARQAGSSGEVCVQALEAGCDMLLLPYNFTNAYNGVMAAVQSGRLTEERIDESVRRILTLKKQWHLIGSLSDGG